MSYTFPPMPEIGNLDLNSVIRLITGFMVAFFVFGLIFLAVWIILCLQFANIAEKKGYSKVGFFFAAFFLGIIGILWIAALKDKVMDSKLDRILASVENQGKLPNV